MSPISIWVYIHTGSRFTDSVSILYMGVSYIHRVADMGITGSFMSILSIVSPVLTTDWQDGGSYGLRATLTGDRFTVIFSNYIATIQIEVR